MKKKAKKAAKAEHALTGKAAKHRDKAPVAVLGAASEVADQPPLIAIGLATLAAGVVLRRVPLARTGVRMLAAHALATGGKALLKNAIDRSRPARALEDGRHHAGKGNGASDTDFNSFPSGHTAGAVSVAQAVARDAPEAARPVRLAAAAVGALQLPRGKHYASDVAVGAAIGWAAEWFASNALDRGEAAVRRWLSARGEARALAEAEAHPS